MKKIIRVTSILLIISFTITTIKTYSQTIDSMALKIVQTHIKLISDYLTSNKNDNRFVGAGSINFLNKLTGIASESDGNFFGQFHPTQDDYDRWSSWLNLNKEFLRWDKKKQVIILHKEIDIPSGW